MKESGQASNQAAEKLDCCATRHDLLTCGVEVGMASVKRPSSKAAVRSTARRIMSAASVDAGETVSR